MAEAALRDKFKCEPTHVSEYIRLGAAGALDVRRHDLAHLLGQCIEKWNQALHVCSREGGVHELAVFAMYIIYAPFNHTDDPIEYGCLPLIGAPSSPRPKTKLRVLHTLHEQGGSLQPRRRD